MSKFRFLFSLLIVLSLNSCVMSPSSQDSKEPEVSISVDENSNSLESQITSIENESEVSSSVQETSNPEISSDSESSSSEQVESIVITVDQTAVALEVGQTIFVTATVTGSENKNVTWTSSDPDVATVSDGTITGTKAGSTAVKAISVADPTKFATVQVTVTEPVVEITNISNVLEIGYQLPNDGKTHSQQFTTRGVYTGTNNKVVQYGDKNSHYARFIQDGTSALLLRNTYDDDWADIQIGDVVEINAFVCNVYGLVQCGEGMVESVKKVTDPSIAAPIILPVSPTSRPALTSADVSRKAHLDAVEVTSISTDSSGNMTVKFSAGEDKKEETLSLKELRNDLTGWGEVKAGSLLTLDSWVGVNYNGGGLQYTYFDNLTVDNSIFTRFAETKMGEINKKGNFIVEGVVTLITKTAVYFDDGTGAVSIHYGSGKVPATYEVGQTYKITGAAYYSYGEYQFAKDSIVEESTVEVAETFLSKPSITSLEQLKADKKEVRNLVAFEGALIAKQNGNNTYLYFNGDMSTPAISPKNYGGTFSVNKEYTIKGYLASWYSYTSCFGLYIASASQNHYDVESVSLDKSEITLKEGSTISFVSTIAPATADQTVTWDSSDTAVATVENGTVIAIASGVATITATSVEDPTKDASAVVTVLTDEAFYIKVGSYDFGTGNTSTAEITDPAVALARFTSSKSADFPESVVTEVKDINKLYAGYVDSVSNMKYFHFGLKFGTSKGDGTMTTALSVPVSRVVVKWIGWYATETLKVGDCEPIASKEQYNAGGVELREDRFDITPSNEVTFTFQRRGFIQTIEFYSDAF